MPTSFLNASDSGAPRRTSVQSIREAPSKPLEISSKESVSPLAARFPRRWLALTHAIERHCFADELSQRALIDFVAFVDVYSPPDFSIKTGIEQT